MCIALVRHELRMYVRSLSSGAGRYLTILFCVISMDERVWHDEAQLEIVHFCKPINLFVVFNGDVQNVYVYLYRACRIWFHSRMMTPIRNGS